MGLDILTIEKMHEAMQQQYDSMPTMKPGRFRLILSCGSLCVDIWTEMQERLDAALDLVDLGEDNE